MFFFQELFPATLPELNTKHPAKGQLPIPLHRSSIFTCPSTIGMPSLRFCQRWAGRGNLAPFSPRGCTDPKATNRQRCRIRSVLKRLSAEMSITLCYCWIRMPKYLLHFIERSTTVHQEACILVP